MEKSEMDNVRILKDEEIPAMAYYAGSRELMAHESVFKRAFSKVRTLVKDNIISHVKRK